MEDRGSPRVLLSSILDPQHSPPPRLYHRVPLGFVQWASLLLHSLLVHRLVVDPEIPDHPGHRYQAGERHDPGGEVHVDAD